MCELRTGQVTCRRCPARSYCQKRKGRK